MACGSPLKVVTKNIPLTYNISDYLPHNTLLQRGKYKIESGLSQGGFGITYKAIKNDTLEVVAIKELFPEQVRRQGVLVEWRRFCNPSQQEQVEKFNLEAEILSNCIHPSIVRYREYFEENNTAYIVMDFIEGLSLDKIIKNETILSEIRIKKYFLQITEALKIVHARGILHRDISPTNILIDRQDRAILIDFGAARQFLVGRTKQMTVILNPGYAPPEQYRPRVKPVPGIDFYALCASMYHGLTGRVPDNSLDREDAMRERRADPLILPIQIVSNISQQMEKILMMGMAINPERRFQDADILIQYLEGNIHYSLLFQARELVKEAKLLPGQKLTNLKKASIIYQKVLEQESNNFEAKVELAEIMLYLDINKAEELAISAIAQKANDRRSYGILGVVKCHQKQWQQGLEYLKYANSIIDRDSCQAANLAMAAWQLKEWETANRFANRALQVLPTINPQHLNLDLIAQNVFILGIKAYIAFEQEEWANVISAARQAITQSKQLSTQERKQFQEWIYPSLILALEKAVTNPKSPDLENCLQECQNLPFTKAYRAWQLAKQGSETEAFNLLTTISLNENFPAWVLLNIAIGYERQKQLMQAQQVYQQYLKIIPNNSFAYFRLGTVQGNLQLWEEAKISLETALQLKTDYAEAYHNLGWVLLNLRKQGKQFSSQYNEKTAYKNAVRLYEQQGKLKLAKIIQEIIARYQ
jgi:serine/threonine protein kinase